MTYYTLKVLLAGDGGVGKTSIIKRFIQEDFKVEYRETIGVDVYHKEVKINHNSVVKLAIWDIAGQDKYSFMRDNFYYGTDGVLLIFDLTNIKTYDHITNWLNEIHNSIGKEIPYILVGNKVDLIEDVGEVVPHDEIEKFVDKKQILFRETSAKTGLHIDIIFNDLVKKIIRARTYNVDLYENLWKTRKD
ncbi:MAG: Rab family GTPase [Promethearchaeota archaeon]